MGFGQEHLCLVFVLILRTRAVITLSLLSVRRILRSRERIALSTSSVCGSGIVPLVRGTHSASVVLVHPRAITVPFPHSVQGLHAEGAVALYA